MFEGRPLQGSQCDRRVLVLVLSSVPLPQALRLDSSSLPLGLLLPPAPCVYLPVSLPCSLTHTCTNTHNTLLLFCGILNPSESTSHSTSSGKPSPISASRSGSVPGSLTGPCWSVIASLQSSQGCLSGVMHCLHCRVLRAAVVWIQPSSIVVQVRAQESAKKIPLLPSSSNPRE